MDVQSFVDLPSGRQGRGRASRVLVVCFILWFVAWILLRFRASSLISTGCLPHRIPTRAVVLELFRYYRHPEARNRSFTDLTAVQRRGRGLLEVSETSDSNRKGMLVEEQLFDGQGFGDNLTRQFDSSRKRKGCNSDHKAMACSQGASSSTRAALEQLPLFGGERTSEQEMWAPYHCFFLDIAAFWLQL
jgi:hypothetical protein